MGILLSILAFLVTGIFTLPMLFYSLFRYKSFTELAKHYKKIAIGVDQLLNVICKYFLDDTMIEKDSPSKFGNEDETISGVYGKNKLLNRLTPFGWFFAKKLNKLEDNHVENAIEEDEK